MADDKISNNTLISWAVSIVLLTVTGLAILALKDVKSEVTTSTTLNNSQETRMAVEDVRITNLENNYRDIKTDLGDIKTILSSVKKVQPKRDQKRDTEDVLEGR